MLLLLSRELVTFPAFPSAKERYILRVSTTQEDECLPYWIPLSRQISIRLFRWREILLRSLMVILLAVSRFLLAFSRSSSRDISSESSILACWLLGFGSDFAASSCFFEESRNWVGRHVSM